MFLRGAQQALITRRLAKNSQFFTILLSVLMALLRLQTAINLWFCLFLIFPGTEILSGKSLRFLDIFLDNICHFLGYFLPM